MHNSLYIDSETFSSVDIKKAGGIKYAKSCEMMLCGFKLNGQYEYFDFSVPSKTVIPEWVVNHINHGGEVVCHNAIFDYCVLLPHIPQLKLEQMTDTMAICGALGLPLGLDKATKALGADIGKYAGGSRLITKFCMPRKPSKLNPLTRWMPSDAPEDWKEFRDVYLKADIDSMEELHDSVPPLETNVFPTEQQVWEDTQKINLSGIPVDLETVNLIKSKLTPMIDEESSEFIRIVGLFPTQRDKILGWVRSQGVKILDLKAGTVASVLADPKTPEHVKKALEHRANTTHMSFKKFDAILAAVCDDGTVKGGLQSHVASTGRFGGRLIQPQNLTKGNIDGEEAVSRIQAGEFSVELVKSAVRPMISSPKGFSIEDYASIEARIVQWVAGDEDALDVFRSGKDPYIVQAAKIYGVSYEEVTSSQRFVGKQSILGLGFQMSAKKFISMVESYGETITKEEASLAVEVYRSTHRKLVKLWSDLEGAAILAIQRPDDTVRVNQLIEFNFEAPFLFMRLPSGRRLAYFQPNLEHSAWGLGLSYMSMNDKHQYVRTHTYGGKLVENAVQAIARDLLVYAVHNILKEGHRIITHIHDEIVVEGHVREDIARIMCDTPDWAEGLPIATDGEEVMRYKKI